VGVQSFKDRPAVSHDVIGHLRLDKALDGGSLGLEFAQRLWGRGVKLGFQAAQQISVHALPKCLQVDQALLVVIPAARIDVGPVASVGDFYLDG